LAAGASEPRLSAAKQRKRERGVWQPRSYEHTIRDEDDMAAHVDYIHFNPVKHGHVDRPIDWPWSSLHDFVARGILDPSWGVGWADEPGSAVDGTEVE
jgi:putative transposase